jgi:hypothetical protein
VERLTQYRSIADKAAEKGVVKLIIENLHKLRPKQRNPPSLKIGPFSFYQSLSVSDEFQCIKILNNIFKNKANCEKLKEIPEIDEHLRAAIPKYPRLAAFVSR